MALSNETHVDDGVDSEANDANSDENPRERNPFDYH